MKYLESWPDPPRSVFELAATLEWALDGDPDALRRVAATDPEMRRRAWDMHDGLQDMNRSATTWSRYVDSIESWGGMT